MTNLPSLAALWFLGDNDHGMLAICVHSEDTFLRAVRHEAAFETVVASVPGVQVWREVFEPCSAVFAMGAIDNVSRRMTVDGVPLVLGLHHVGDALASTNPNRGRGTGMALAAVGRLVDVLIEHEVDAAAQASSYDAWIERSLLPYFRESAVWDRARAAQLRADLRGESVPPAMPLVETPQGPGLPTPQDVMRAAGLDVHVWRAIARENMLIDDDRAVADPALLDRVRRVLADEPAASPPATPAVPIGELTSMPSAFA